MHYEHLRPMAILELQKYGLTDPRLLTLLESRVSKYLKSVKEREQGKEELERAVQKKGKL